MTPAHQCQITTAIDTENKLFWFLYLPTKLVSVAKFGGCYCVRSGPLALGNFDTLDLALRAAFDYGRPR